MGFLFSILAGVIIFWATSQIMNIKGWGLLMNILFVVGGSVVGKMVLRAAGLYAGDGFVPSIISGVIGCCIVIAAIRILKK